MKQTQITNYRKSSSITLLLRRLLESLGLYSKLKIPTSLGRRSSVVILALIAFTITSLSLVTPPVSATAPTITISLPSTPLKLTILPSSDNGTFASSNDLNFTVTTDNYTGYQLSIAASTSGANATSLVSGNNTIATLPAGSSLSENDFKNGASYINKWGYLPSKLNSVSNTTYRPAPDSSGTLLDNRSSAGTNIAYTISIGAKVATSQPLGDYSNTFVITAVANLTNYSITYVANDGASGADTTNMPSTNPQVGSVDTSTNTITLASAPSRTGYTFMGWCTVQVADDAACSGTEYSAGGTYNINYTGSNTFSLYARWEELPRVYMQDFTVAECQAQATNAPVTVYDRRDGSDYTVRYFDNACWMTQNLRITKSTGQADWVISSTDSNFSTNSTWNIHVSDLTAGNSSRQARSHVADAASVTAANNAGYTTTLDGQTVTTKTLGAWYNLCAASAGTVCDNSTVVDATEDICPAGWHLPSYNNAPGALRNISAELIAGETNNASLFNPVYGGYYHSGALTSAGGEGGWWSPIAYDSSSQRYIFYYSTTLLTRWSSRSRGNYVRCVRTPNPMQDQTSSTLAAMMPNVGDTTTLYDKRDGKIYRVGKLADNNYWMLDNLALDLTDADVKTAMYDASDASHNTLTNASNATLGYLFNGGGTTSNQYPTAKLNNAAWTSSSQNYYSIPMMVLSGICNNAYCVNNPSSGTWSYDAITDTTINGTTSIARGKIGVYYNYCAASAGSYCYGSGISTTGSPYSDPDTSTLRDVIEDICPSGWRLPTSSYVGEFATLYTAYDSNRTSFQTALSTPLSGYFYSGKANLQGSNGRFWSSTWSTDTNMYLLDVHYSNVSPSGNLNRHFGFSIRCILSS